jgi:hypothetical protein
MGLDLAIDQRPGGHVRGLRLHDQRDHLRQLGPPERDRDADHRISGLVFDGERVWCIDEEAGQIYSLSFDAGP